MIERINREIAIRDALRRSRVVALIGPRQCGKTTLARKFVDPRSKNYFDLEVAAHHSRLDEPMTALERLRGTVVIDEVQHKPDLFPLLRVLADRRPLPAKFLILGSAGQNLLQQSSESLAGRIEVLQLSGFGLDEIGATKLNRHWRRGGFPLSFLARSERESVIWRTQFIKSFLERDLQQFGVNVPPVTMLRFLTMIAHYHGGIWSGAEAARSLGASEPTARRYLDQLTGLFMVRQLQPWHENLLKRQVKSPKVYVRDNGLLHQLLGINTEAELLLHPKKGASWEGYIIEEVLRLADTMSAYFWATHQGAELDLFILKNGRRYGVEIKYQDAPAITPSMRIAMNDLALDHLTVIYPGDQPYELRDNITIIPAAYLARKDAEAQIFPPIRTAASRKKK